jgi:hypothetical protein
LAPTIPLIESANAPANSDDMFIRFMCFLPRYFNAGRFADLALPKVPVERDNAPIRCQGDRDMPSRCDGVPWAVAPRGAAATPWISPRSI